MLRLARGRIFLAPRPNVGIDRLHRVRTHRIAPARLMRREQDLGAAQCRRARVFDDVVVVANEYADPTAVRGIENRVLAAFGNESTYEDVKLAMARPAPIGHRYDVSVVEPALFAALDQPGTDAHPVLSGETKQLPGALATWYGLGKRLDLVAREFSHVPVSGEAHLGERDYLDA